MPLYKMKASSIITALSISLMYFLSISAVSVCVAEGAGKPGKAPFAVQEPNEGCLQLSGQRTTVAGGSNGTAGQLSLCSTL